MSVHRLRVPPHLTLSEQLTNLAERAAERKECRTVVSLFLYIGAITGTPPENSDITYVKIQPITDQQDITHPKLAQFRESRIENVPLTIRGYNIDDKEPKTRRIRSDDVTTFSYDSDEATESTTIDNTSIEEEIDTDDYEVSKRPPSPRFYSKLSYFQKENEYNSVSTNLVNTLPWKRKFRSRCRCERIWNCPKLQISVPRCPEEYFMCCFP